jgi:hypothetical protein
MDAMAFSISGSSFTRSSWEGAFTAFFKMPVIEGLADSVEVDAGAEVVVEFEAVGEMGSA